MAMKMRWPRLPDPTKIVLVLMWIILLNSYIVQKSPASPPEVPLATLQYHQVPLESSSSDLQDNYKSIIVTRNKTWDKLQHAMEKSPIQFTSSPANISALQGQQWERTSQNTKTGYLESMPGEPFNKTADRELRETLEQLLDILSTPTYHCKKLLRMGGFSCNHTPDGEKRVCHDPKLYPPGAYCLVYSVGVGHDLTFDIAMGNFGCEVFAFDSDVYHRNYPTFISDSLTFYKVRVGTYFLREIQVRTYDKELGPFMVEYWPLPNIMDKLGHVNHLLHYLKIDIEGSEWAVLEETVFKTNILEGTQQLALEVHLEDFLQGGGSLSTQALLNSVNKYLRMVRGLQDRGFHLAHWEPNYRGPVLTTLAGLTFHVYSETLWVNPSYQPRLNYAPKHTPPEKL
ncbi:uncharacterized protein LOC121868035 [Homarus americanus]|nr:uncharacterized protein LOC121868035 [Homarus americanus]XP_042224219.1 uncharacterized protein LOC121868035 [Homarus americanus]